MYNKVLLLKIYKKQYMIFTGSNTALSAVYKQNFTDKEQDKVQRRRTRAC